MCVEYTLAAEHTPSSSVLTPHLPDLLFRSLSLVNSEDRKSGTHRHDLSSLLDFLLLPRLSARSADVAPQAYPVRYVRQPRALPRRGCCRRERLQSARGQLGINFSAVSGLALLLPSGASLPEHGAFRLSRTVFASPRRAAGM